MRVSFSLSLFVGLVLGLIFFVPFWTDAYSGLGSGTSVDPYQVTTCMQLQEINDDLSADYILMNNIDCSETATWNLEDFSYCDGDLDFVDQSSCEVAELTWVDQEYYRGFEPLGDYDIERFTGTLDGDGYTISSLFINRANDVESDQPGDESYVGLFNSIDSGAVIRNLRLENIFVKGWQSVGGLVGAMVNGNIDHVVVDNSEGEDDCSNEICVWARYGYYGGGLVGYVEGGEISDIEVYGPVKGSGTTIGGLIGYLLDGEIFNITADVYVDGGQFIGGLLGTMAGGVMTDAEVLGSIATITDESVGKAGFSGGGVVGIMEGGSLENISADVEVTADNGNAGGFAGIVIAGTITRSSASGSVTGEVSGVGGFVGSIGYFFTSAEDVEISESFAMGDVVGAGYVGGFVGNIEASDKVELFKNYATGNVSGGANFNTSFGGFVGAAFGNDSDRTIISESYATGTVTALEETSSEFGGFAGYINGFLISDSYATGDVVASGNLHVGGFAGDVDGAISRAYATGDVTGGTVVGGFAGLVGAPIVDAFSTGSVTGATTVAGFIAHREDAVTPDDWYWFNNPDDDAVNCYIDEFDDQPGDDGCLAIDEDGVAYFQGTSAHPPLDDWDFSLDDDESTIWVAVSGAFPTLFALASDDPEPSDVPEQDVEEEPVVSDEETSRSSSASGGRASSAFLKRFGINSLSGTQDASVENDSSPSVSLNQGMLCSVYGSETLIRRGSRGENARGVQKAVNQIQQNKPQLVEDGIIGPQSLQGIIDVQKILGTSPDGLWGVITQGLYKKWIDNMCATQ